MEYKHYYEASELDRIRIQATFLKKSIDDIQDTIYELIEKLRDGEVPSLRQKEQEQLKLKHALQHLYRESVHYEYDVTRDRLLKRLKADIFSLKKDTTAKKLRNHLKKHYFDLRRRNTPCK